jgi:hypothetical protein
MKNDKTNITYNGAGFAELLCLAFIVLKLTNVINWSWWIVTAPIWIQFILIIITLIFYAFVKYIL